MEDGEALTKVRRGQAAFARLVKENYGSSGAICGVDLPALLVVGHIKPWADDLDHRLDPANGLCLCALDDRPFDKGLITLSPQRRVVASSELKSTSSQKVREIIAEIEGVRLRPPTSQPPDEKMLEYHRTAIFRGASPCEGSFRPARVRERVTRRGSGEISRV